MSPQPIHYFEFEGTIVFTTAKAIQIRYEHPEEGIIKDWFPRSQLLGDYDTNDKSEQVFQVAKWLATEKRMI